MENGLLRSVSTSPLYSAKEKQQSRFIFKPTVPGCKEPSTYLEFVAGSVLGEHGAGGEPSEATVKHKLLLREQDRRMLLIS